MLFHVIKTKMPPIWGHFYHRNGGKHMQIRQKSKDFLDEDAQGLVEYGLILILAVVVVVISLTSFGQSVNNLFEVIEESVLNL